MKDLSQPLLTGIADATLMCMVRCRKICKSDAEFLASNISYLISAIEEGNILFVNCTYVKFSYGYTKRTMTFEIKDITIGHGRPEWGAPEEEVFIIKLGERIA